MRFFYKNIQFTVTDLLADIALTDTENLRVYDGDFEAGVALLSSYAPQREEGRMKKNTLDQIVARRVFLDLKDGNLEVLKKAFYAGDSIERLNDKVLGVEYVQIDWSDGRFDGRQNLEISPEVWADFLAFKEATAAKQVVQHHTPKNTGDDEAFCGMDE